MRHWALILWDWRTIPLLTGAAMWDCFHQRDPEAHHWYYRTIADVLAPLSASAAWREYDWLIRQVFDEGECAPDSAGAE